MITRIRISLLLIIALINAPIFAYQQEADGIAPNTLVIASELDLSTKDDSCTQPYTLSAYTSDCNVNNPIQLQLSGSTDGRTYHLRESDWAPGDPPAASTNGNGGVIYFTGVYAGIEYKVYALAHSGCSETYVDTYTAPAPPVLTTPTVTNGSLNICIGDAVTVTPSGGTDATAYKFYTQASGGTAISVTSGGLTTDILQSYTISSVNSGTVDYYISAYKDGCESSLRKHVTVTGVALPSAPSIASFNVCSGSNATMNPTASGATTYHWYAASSGGTPVHSGTSWTINNFTDASRTYYISSENSSGCESSSRTQVTITRDDPAQKFTLSQETYACTDNSAVSIRLSDSEIGVTYKIYEQGGSSSPVQTLPGNGNHLIFDTGIYAGQSYYIEADNPGVCTGTTTMNNTLPVVTYDALTAPSQSNLTVCDGSSVTLSPSGGGSGNNTLSTYRWYTAATGGSTHGADALTMTFNASSGVTDYFIAAVSTNGCIGPRKHVTVTGTVVPGAPTISNFSVCSGSNATMTPSEANASEYKWYATSSGGTPVYTGTSWTINNFTDASRTYHVSSVSSAGCESSSRTQVTITRDDPALSFDLTQHTMACTDAESVIIRQSGSESGIVYNLYNTTNLSTSLQTITGDGNTIDWDDDDITANNTYIVKATNTGSCSGQVDMNNTVAVVTYDALSAPTLSETVIIGCNGSSLTLDPSGGGGGNNPVSTYRWFKTVAGSETWYSDATQVTFDIEDGVKDFYIAAVSSNGCVGPRTHVSVTGNEPPTNFNLVSATGVTEFCGFTGVLKLLDSEEGVTYSLYRDNTFVSQLTGSGGYLLWSNISTSGTYEVRAVDSVPCEVISNQVTMNFTPTPVAFALSESGTSPYCGDATISLSDSESGVTYALYRNGEQIGTQTGTGNALSWSGIHRSGVYTVTGSKANCGYITDMAGTLDLSFDTEKFTVSGGGALCTAEGTSISLDGSQYGRDYFLELNGTIDNSSRQKGNGLPLNWPGITVIGTYKIIASPTCSGNFEMEGSVSVTSGAQLQRPVVDNEIFYSDELTGNDVTFTVDEAPGTDPNITYEWYVSGNYQATGDSYTMSGFSSSGELWVEVRAKLNSCYSEFTEAYALKTKLPLTISHLEACNLYYIRVTETPPANTVWYWQGTNPNGTDMTLDASTYDYRVTRNNTYYLRAYDFLTRTWEPYSEAYVFSALDENERIIPKDCADINAVEVLSTPPAYNGNASLNLVRSYDVMKSGMSDNDIVNASTSPNDVALATSYVDGLGRPFQTVSRKAAPDEKDLVQPVAFDDFGRTTASYLPFASTESNGDFKSNPFNDQKTFYEGHEPDEEVYYSLNVYEESPLNRVKMSLAPGDAWAGNRVGVSLEYDVNLAEEGIRIWHVNSNGEPESLINDIYESGQLTITTSQDEDGNHTREFKTKSGLVVLKQVQNQSSPSRSHTGWLNTYYVYDDYNLLRFVIPPKAAGILENESTAWDWNSSNMDELVFKYEYDTRGRMTSKHVPGAGKVEVVYDQYDRLVLTQDANQRNLSTPQWTFTKYDRLGRVVMTGMLNTTDTRSDFETTLDTWSKKWFVEPVDPNPQNAVEGESIVLSAHVPDTEKYHAEETIEFLPGFETDEEFETEIGGTLQSDYTVFQGYQDASFPLLADNSHEILTVNHFDNYDFTNKEYEVLATDPGFETVGIRNALAVPANAQDFVSGQATGSHIKVLGTADQWLNTVIFYDDRGNAIQTHGDNHTGGTDVITNQFDFSGKILYAHSVHNNPLDGTNGSTTTFRKLEYDHAGRISQVSQKINNESVFKLLVKNEYNAIGELDSKELGVDPLDTNTPLETLNYSYNIRGWMTGINDAYVQGNSDDNFFGMTLSYNDGFNVGGGNGNIVGTTWRTTSDTKVKSYGYRYDHSNRLTKADYGQGTGWSNVNADFSVSNLTYDVNGNILSLRREGMVAGVKTTIDNLTYTYQSNSNKLIEVADAAGNQLQGDFNDGFTGTDYDYDLNGNMEMDKNKGIEGGDITYNHLNLPVQITFDGNANKTITYTYDAAGIKLKKVVNDGGTLTTTDYVGAYIYENNALQQFAHDEGRVRLGSNGFEYDYYLKDHLGNTRLTITEETQETIYLATMETDVTPAPESVNLETFEENLFLNLDAVRDNLVSAANSTNITGITNDESARLNGSVAARQVGPAKMLAVAAGDQVKIEVNAYHQGSYIDQGDAGSAAMASALIAAFGGVNGGTTEQQFTYDVFNGNAASTLIGTQGNTSDPRAYLNYILFDDNLNVVDLGYKQVNNTADTHQALELNTITKGSGFIYIYVSNESAANHNIYFDDLRITHSQGTLLQEDHYYPFGMTIASLSSSAPLSKPNKFKYNGFEEQTEFDLGWYDYHARQYDSQLGRFTSNDPLADLMTRITPYAYAFNNPMRFIDPDGMMPEDEVKRGVWYRNGDGDVVYTSEVSNENEFDAAEIEGEFLGIQATVKVTTESEGEDGETTTSTKSYQLNADGSVRDLDSDSNLDAGSEVALTNGRKLLVDNDLPATVDHKNGEKYTSSDGNTYQLYDGEWVKLSGVMTSMWTINTTPSAWIPGTDSYIDKALLDRQHRSQAGAAANAVIPGAIIGRVIQGSGYAPNAQVIGVTIIVNIVRKQISQGKRNAKHNSEVEKSRGG